MKIKSKNKGELSELYTLVRLLADGKIYAADEDLKRIKDCFMPILKIFREEKNKSLEYELTENHVVKLYLDGSLIRSIESTELDILAKNFFKVLEAGNGMTLAEEVMQKLQCEKVKASSRDKIDIKMQVHDPVTNYNVICGYSIKSDIGNAPTLFNASQATNFKFEVKGLTASQIEEINSIESKGKIRDRVKKIKKFGTSEFVGVENETFARNLLFIDNQMEKFLAEMLKIYYGEDIASCVELAAVLEDRDPFNFKTQNLYRHKLKKFLCAVALGLNPTQNWNGLDEANGGYIIVKKSGEVVAYHLHDRNSFENYLLKNTSFDTPSSSRHNFGKIFAQDGKYFIRLNFQIRFKKSS